MGNFDKVYYYLLNKGDVNAKIQSVNTTGLINAVINNNKNIVKLLLDYKIDVNVLNWFGDSAIFLAYLN